MLPPIALPKHPLSIAATVIFFAALALTFTGGLAAKSCIEPYPEGLGGNVQWDWMPPGLTCERGRRVVRDWRLRLP